LLRVRSPAIALRRPVANGTPAKEQARRRLVHPEYIDGIRAVAPGLERRRRNPLAWRGLPGSGDGANRSVHRHGQKWESIRGEAWVELAGDLERHAAGVAIDPGELGQVLDRDGAAAIHHAHAIEGLPDELTEPRRPRDP
jgi:hypothetical protein